MAWDLLGAYLWGGEKFIIQCDFYSPLFHNSTEIPFNIHFELDDH